MTLPNDPNQMLCYCLGVRQGEVEAAVREHGCKTVAQVTAACKAGGGCKSCHPEIREILSEVRGATKSRGWLGRLFGKG